MGIIAWLLLGLIAGFIASKIVDHHGLGILRDILLGIVGAVVGGGIFHWAMGYRIERLNLGSVLVATGGAVVVLVLWQALTGRQRSVLARP